MEFLHTMIPKIGLGNDFIKNWKTVSLQLITRVGKDGIKFLQVTGFIMLGHLLAQKNYRYANGRYPANGR
jgi:hypothetical protein